MVASAPLREGLNLGDHRAEPHLLQTGYFPF